MSSLNQLTLIGRLGADPEKRSTQTGKSVCNFRLATGDTYQDRNGNTQESTEWHSVVAWDKLGELCYQFLAKGRQVYIQGPLRSRTYTDKQGVERRSWEVVAKTVTFLGSKTDAQPESSSTREPWDKNSQSGSGGAGWGGGPNQGGWGNSNQGGGGWR